MAPLLATDWTSPDWSTVGIVVVSVWATACVISSIVVLVVMCACGGKKKQEELPPTDEYPKAPEPAPLAEPVAEQQQMVPPPEDVEPSAKTAVEMQSQKSYVSKGSMLQEANDAAELQLMSRIEDPKMVNASSSIGVGGRRAGGQSVMNQPSLVLMDGMSVLHPVKTTAAAPAPAPVVKASSGHSISWVNPSPQSASSVQGPRSMSVGPASTSKSVTSIQGSSKTKSVHSVIVGA